MTYDLAGKKVYVAGHKGMVGSAMVRRLEREGCEVIVPQVRVDLREQVAVREWMAANKSDAVVVAGPRWAASSPTIRSRASSPTTT